MTHIFPCLKYRISWQIYSKNYIVYIHAKITLYTFFLMNALNIFHTVNFISFYKLLKVIESGFLFLIISDDP